MERAVIYCRVSTEEEIQINALESQIKEAREAAACNGWGLAGEYIDDSDIIGLNYLLAKRGHRTALIDFDGQGHSSIIFGVKNPNKVEVTIIKQLRHLTPNQIEMVSDMIEVMVEHISKE